MSNSVWGNGYYTGYNTGYQNGMKMAGVVGTVGAAVIIGGVLAFKKAKEKKAVMPIRDKLAHKVEDWLLGR